MTSEFVDTNVLSSVEDRGVGGKYQTAVDLVARLAREDSGVYRNRRR